MLSNSNTHIINTMSQSITFAERLQLVMKHKGLNKNSLTVKLGLPANSVIGRIVNDQARPSYEVMRALVELFTDINPRWLITGEGSMLGKETASLFEKGEIQYFKAGSGEPFPGDNGNLKATAILTLYGFTDCQYAFDVFGDSMAPRFRPGDLILCSEHSNKTILPGEAYLIVTTGTPVIRIIKGSNTNACYILSAENPRFGDYEVSREDVSHLYLVKGLIRREVF